MGDNHELDELLALVFEPPAGGWLTCGQCLCPTVDPGSACPGCGAPPATEDPPHSGMGMDTQDQTNNTSATAHLMLALQIDEEIFTEEQQAAEVAYAASVEQFELAQQRLVEADRLRRQWAYRRQRVLAAQEQLLAGRPPAEVRATLRRPAQP